MLRIKFLAFSVVSIVYSLFFAAAPVVAAQNDSLSVVETVVESVTSAVTPPSVQYSDSPFFSGLEDVLIPVVAIVTPFLIAFLIVFFVLRYQLSQKKAKYAVVEKALEMGKELPADFFRDTRKKTKTPLESALVLVAVGLGFIVMGALTSSFFYGIGALCSLIGIAKFIAWKIEQPKNETDNNNINE